MDAIVILGAAVWQNGPSPTLVRRTTHAATLWHAGRAPLVVACGGLGQHAPTEAEAMRSLLVSAGVPDDVILTENTSTTTLENIRNALPLLPGPNIIIVTDRYHARRAGLVASHFRLRAVVDSPPAGHLHIKQYIRELFALPAYALKLRRTPRS
ncbi:MAG: YdcF family protein [Pseudomonadota bacterium]